MKIRLLALAGVLMASVGLARADNYGCTVLLCLANPAGPMAVSECVPPIQKLFRDLAKGRSFPSCQMASAPDAPAGKSWAEHGVSHYDSCPAGTTALDAGTYAMKQGSRTPYLGIGEGNDPDWEDAGGLRDKVCVGNRVGSTTLRVSEGEIRARHTAGVFDEVVVVSPTAQPNYIDVYVDSRFSHRVRW